MVCLRKEDDPGSKIVHDGKHWGLLASEEESFDFAQDMLRAPYVLSEQSPVIRGKASPKTSRKPLDLDLG